MRHPSISQQPWLTGQVSSLKPAVLYYSHFGKTGNAVQRRRLQAQLQLWAKIAEEGVLSNRVSKKFDRILKEDPVMRILADFIKAHKIYSITVLENCVDGFVVRQKT